MTAPQKPSDPAVMATSCLVYTVSEDIVAGVIAVRVPRPSGMLERRIPRTGGREIAVEPA